MKKIFLVFSLISLLPFQGAFSKAEIKNTNFVSKNTDFYKDFFGRNLKIPKYINRIVSLSPATTETLFALGLGNKVVGVTNDCNYPQSALKKEKTGKFGFINFEKVVSLKPDIIFATYDMSKQLGLLKKYNVPVITVNTTDINSIYSNIVEIGKITDSLKTALKIKNDFNFEINKVKEKSKLLNNKSVFYCIWHDPIITAGKGSFINDIISTIGAKNIASTINNPFAKYSIESLVANNPQYIFIPKTTYDKINFKSLPWNKLKAVENKKVFSVNDDIYLRPSPRIIIAIKEMQKTIIDDK